MKARKTASILALGVFAVLVVRAVSSGPPVTQGRFELAMLMLLPVIGSAAVLLLAGRKWGRWLALGGAVAVLPWASVLTASPFVEKTAPIAALAACITLFVTLGGRGAGRRVEGDDHFPLLSWTIICNVASILVLYLFVAAYDYQIGWHVGVTGALLVGLLGGVLRLAAGKTVGILIVAACCLLLVPAVAYFVSHEAVFVGEAFLLMAAFLPGVVTAAACIAVFGAPMWRVLRD